MWMWATSPLPSPSPWPSNISFYTITTSTKSPRRLFSLAVSAQPPQQPRTHNDHSKDGLVGQAVLTAFKSNAKHQSGVRHDASGQQRPLSGSDVLWALKRAAAEKSKKKKKAASFASRAPGHRNGQDNAAADYSGVRPLTIKNDWSVRLEQLEKRLQQLMDA